MTRARRRGGLVASWEWTPDIACMFPAPAGWIAPARVKVCRGKAHLTISARFRTPAGYINTARVRIEINAHSGEPEIVSTELLQSLTVRAA